MNACAYSRLKSRCSRAAGLAAVAFLTAAFVFLGVYAASAEPTGTWFHLSVSPQGDATGIGGNGWSPNTLTTATIDDPGTAGTDFSVSVTTDGSGWLSIPQPSLNTSALPGYVVTVSDGTHVKTHTVTYVAVMGFDLTADRVSGLAAYNTTVHVEAYSPWSGPMSERTVQSNGAGGWLADFSVAEGLNPTLDIRLGMHIVAIAIDDDDDGTQTDYFIHNPMVAAQSANDQIEGGDWPASSQVTMTIDDPGNGTGVDFTRVLPVSPDGGVHTSLQGAFDVAVGQHVRMVCDPYEKELVVAPIDIGGADVALDIATGTASPFATVHVMVWGIPGQPPARFVDADASGHWQASFAESVSPEPWGQPFDLQRGANVVALVPDTDGDQSRAMYQIPNPVLIVAPDGDGIWGNGWPNGVSVTITIDDPSNGVGVDHTESAFADENGNFDAFTRDEEPFFDITPGMLVTATDGTHVKMLTLTNIAVTSVDPASDIITGTAEPGVQVQVTVNPQAPRQWPMRFTTADGSGNWHVDFGVSAGEEEWAAPFDIILGSAGCANEFDADDDQTQAMWRVPRPLFGVDAVGERVWGRDWKPGGKVTVTFDDAGTPGVDHTQDFDVQPQGEFFSWDDNGSQLGDFDIKPGMLVTVTDGESTKTQIVAYLTLFGVDPVSDTASGTAEPGSTVQVAVFTGSWPNPMRFVTADGSGNWLADFSVESGEDDWAQIYDLALGNSGAATVQEPDGDSTQIDWYIPRPVIFVNPMTNQVSGGDWPTGARVAIGIDDPATLPNPDATRAADVDAWSSFNLEPADVEIDPGDVVTVSYGTTVKTLVVTPLTVDGVDKESDAVSGTAVPGSTLQSWLDGTDTGGDVAVGPDGHWSISYAGQHDIDVGWSGGVAREDEDGDQTQVTWNIPNTRVGAEVAQNWFEACEWPAGSALLATIDDPTTVLTPDWSGGLTCDEWGNAWQGALGVLTLKTGDVLTVTDGKTTRQLVMTDIAVTELDADADTVRGTATPGTFVRVQVWNEADTTRELAASGAGTWTADFSATVPPGNEPWQQPFDITKGQDGRASQPDEDGDETYADWHVPNPCIQADPSRDAIGGWDWAPGTSIDVTVEDSLTVKSPDVTRTVEVDGGGNFWIEGDLGIDIDGDCAVRATDGATEKYLDVTALSVNVDAETDIVNGTADPLTEVGVWVGEYWGDPVFADAGGHWERDYSALTDPVIDITPGQEGGAMQRDPDGDQTQIDWRVPTPRVTASPSGDWIECQEWPVGATVLVAVYEPGSPGTPSLVVTATVDEGGNASLWDTGFDIAPGQRIVVSDASTTKELLVTNLSITEVDADADTVQGSAGPSVGLGIEVWNEPGTYRDVIANGAGVWVVDFTDAIGSDEWMLGCDIVKGSQGRAYQTDEDGDQTAADWYVPNPRISVYPEDDVVTGEDWLPASDVTVTVDASGTPPGAEAVRTARTSGEGGFDASDLGLDLKWGDTVVVTDGTTVKTHVVTELALESVDWRTGVIAGTAHPDAQLTGWFDGEGGGEVLADSHGDWAFSYGREIPQGQSGNISQGDEDADQTIINFHVPSPQIWVDPVNDTVDGSDWTQWAVATIGIDDTTTVQSPDFQTTRATDRGGDFGTDDLSGSIDIKPGMVVTVSDGDFAKTHTASRLTVSGANLVADTVTGTADPLTSVWVRAFPDDGYHIERFVQADSHGVWVADFSEAVGSDPWDATFDIVDGSTGVAAQGDDDADFTQVPWLAEGWHDDTAPVTHADGVPAGWASADVTVTLSAEDEPGGSGVASIRYVVGNGSAVNAVGAIAHVGVSAQGTTTISFRAIDTSGNAEATDTVTVRIDKTAPAAPDLLSYSTISVTSVTLSWPTVVDSDGMSGLDGYRVYVDGVFAGSTAGTTREVGGLVAGSTHTFAVRSRDRAGNETPAPGTLLEIKLPNTFDSNEVPAGSDVVSTLTVDAMSAGGSVQTGTVTVVFDNVTTAGTLSLVHIEDPPSDPPATLKFMGQYYDLDFTGSFTGTVTVTLPYDPRIPDARALEITLAHWKDNAWEDLPTAVNLEQHTLTAELTSLSPIVLVEPASTATTATIRPTSTVQYPAYGKGAVFTIRLAAPGGTPLAGFGLLFDRFSGDVWRQVATCTPVAGVPGSYRVTVKPASGIRTLFNARLAVNPLYTAATSRVTVVPHAKLTTPRSSTYHPRRYKAFYVSGTIYPKRVLTAHVRVYRYSRGRYRLYTTKTVKTSSGGYYRLRIKLRAGSYKFKTYVGTTSSRSTLARSYSPYSRKVSVK